MAFDGITTNCMVKELREALIGQRISKIAQPEKEELLLTFKGIGGANRLLISANASLPFLYMSAENKTGPAVAPNFCMLLRKHIANGRIADITQPSLERVIKITVEHLDELGDPALKNIYVELMGKHSNIIFCDENDMILDSIKHVGSQMSSVREVLPNRPYFIPKQKGKENPLTVSKQTFMDVILNKPTSVFKALYTSLVGFSPILATETVYRSHLDADMPAAGLTVADKEAIYQCFLEIITDIKTANFKPCIYYDEHKGHPVEFCCIPLTVYADKRAVSYEKISPLLEEYYAKRNKYTNMHQKSSDLRKIIQIHLERNRKKYQLQKKQLEDTQKKDKYRIYGEMLHTYGYQCAAGDRRLDVINYYTGEPLSIPLDATLTAMENAQKYFDKYGKLKRTQEALSSYIVETENEIRHLESILSNLELAENDADLSAIKDELAEYGFIKKHASAKKKAKTEKSKPLHFVDNHGFHIYVGKNNYQNDYLTFQFATGNDWWFHAKGVPGSHVIVKTEGRDLPDETFETAASLAAYYSGIRDSDKAEIDYLQKKNVKKPNAAALGFVIYYTNFSMVAVPSLNHVTLVE